MLYLKSFLLWCKCSFIKGFLLIVPLKATRGQRNFRFWLHGVMHTAELDFAVWFTPWSLPPQWDVHRGAWLRSMMHTMELEFTVWCTLRSRTPRDDAHYGVWLCGGMGGSFLKFEYLGEIETEFEHILACISGAQMGSNHENNGDRKSRDTFPFNIRTGSQDFTEWIHTEKILWHCTVHIGQ